MVLSPACVLLAAIGAMALLAHRRIEAVALLVALTGGALWTDAISYHNADPAPYDRFAELQRINERFAGQGPTTTFEFEEYGKYFLRDLAPNALTEGVNRGDVPISPARTVRFGVSSEPDDWTPAGLSQYRLLVVRRGPLESRPPSNFSRVWRGRWYSVWRRDASAPVPAEHVPLGNRLDPAEDVSCAQVRPLAAAARAAGGRLAYAQRPKLAVLNVAGIGPPANWGVDVTDPAVLRPLGQGRITGRVRVPTGGELQVWAEGSFGRAERISVDGRVVGSVGPGLSPRGGAARAGSVRVDAGRRVVSLFVGGGDLRPGNGGTNRIVGPVILTPARDVDAVAVRTVAPARYRTLCGRHLDWLEVLPG